MPMPYWAALQAWCAVVATVFPVCRWLHWPAHWTTVHSPGSMNAGAQAYLPKTYRETQALGVLRVCSTARAIAAWGRRTRRGRCSRACLRDGGRKWPSDRPNPYSLTGRELQVLTHVCEGRSNLNIAKRLKITEGTVKIHLSTPTKAAGGEPHSGDPYRERWSRCTTSRCTSRGRCVAARLASPHMSDESHHQGRSCSEKRDPARALYYIQQGKVALPETATDGEVLCSGDRFFAPGIPAPAARAAKPTPGSSALPPIGLNALGYFEISIRLSCDATDRTASARRSVPSH